MGSASQQQHQKHESGQRWRIAGRACRARLHKHDV